ncbi:hypothetical protein Clacol_003771 [Clathrus columnatus]|uniref:RAD50-interacting protein 1 n=1 Tax=Clathrus columnatus TaxID=1419009 RepID=A0AAV5A8N2_9AGAM|nr:hypothetical protein Clacol_003771 [Clathrus columnatus]
MASTTQIRHLSKPPQREEIYLQTTQLLNSKFSSLGDLETENEVLKKLMENAKTSYEINQADYLRARKSRAIFLKDTTLSIHSSLNTAKENSLSRHALADELGNLTSKLVSSYSHEKQSTLLEDMESLYMNLKELVGVRDYLLVITSVLHLSDSALSQITTWSSSLPTPGVPTFDPSSLKGYHALQLFVSSMARKLNLSPEGQFLHILEFIGWPNAVDLAGPSKRTQFEVAFTNLLHLQIEGENIHRDDSHWLNYGIYPLQTLVIPIGLRFNFHFEGKRDTNRIDKPEWYFTHIANEIHKHRLFLEESVAPLLSSTKYKHINAFKEFIFNLLPLLSRKLHHTIPDMLSHPAILAHTIYKCLAFDADLREEGFSLEGTTANSNKPSQTSHDFKNGVWEGLTEEIIGNEQWFNSWLEGERQFVNDQYNEIISEPTAWKVVDSDHTSIDNEVQTELKPTNSARRLAALVEQVTERYRPLPRFSSRTQFLVRVQLPVLELYHSRISVSLDAFESLSTSFVRAVPGALVQQIGHGVNSSTSTSSLDGLDKLVRAAISASYITIMLEKWSEDVFFLELWSEINTRVASRNTTISSSLPIRSLEQDSIHGAIFQELIDQYHKLIQRAESIIVNHICSEVELGGRAYFSSHHVSGEESLQSLLIPMSTLSACLKLLVWSFPNSMFIKLYRQIVSRLSDLIYDCRVVPRRTGHMSFLEATHIAEECTLWVQSCRVVLEPTVKHSGNPWRKLLDTMKLLTVPEDSFQPMVARIIKATPAELESIQDDLDISMLDLEDLIRIIQIREDFRQ